MLVSDFRILVLDSDREHIEKTRKYMEAMGYRADFSTHPFDALDLIREYKYHLVIFDTNTPGTQELNLVREIKNLNGFTEVVIVTERISLHQILHAFKSGLSNCLFKPLDCLDPLADEIERASDKLNRAKKVINAWKEL